MPGSPARVLRAWRAIVLLTAAFVACSRDGSDAGRLRLLSTNVADGGVWPLNRAMEFRFNQRIDPDSVSAQSILFLSSDGIPVVGATFVDPCSDGKTLVFQPLCPTDTEASNGGLRPGTFNALTLLAGEDLGAVRSIHGRALRAPVTIDFRSPDPATEPLFVDARPGAPPSPSAAVPSPLGLNLFTAPLEPILVVFDQPIDPTQANLDLLLLEFEDPAASGTFLAIPSVATLLDNCAPADCPAFPRATVAVVPQGVLPPDRLVRLVAQAGILDIGGVEGIPADVVVATSVVEPSDPAPSGESDAFVEEFDTGGDEDTAEPFEVPSADWGGGVLQAADPFAGFESTFDWVVSGTVFLDTSFDLIANPSGEPLEVAGGIVRLRNLHVPVGAKIVAQGPNPLVIQASGRVTVSGEISVDGTDALNTGGLNTPELPQSGAPGNCGGGQGGTASPSTVSSDPQGEDGFGPGNLPSGGGEGGHSSFGTIDPWQRRGGGGGGGILTRKTHSLPFAIGAQPWPVPLGLNGGNGGPATTGVSDCVDFALPVDGGAFGPDVFVDADLTNDFFGRKFLAGGSPLAGELNSPVAGQGGGGGGDAVFYSASTPSPNCLNNPAWSGNPGDRKGGAGGGGGGILIVRALGPVVITATGKLSAKGGNGGHGESILFINPAGGGGGGGSGGMIVIESADASDPDPGIPGNPNFPASTLPGGIRIEGTGIGRIEVRGGDGGLCVDASNTPTTVCRGGMGGGGVAQLHTARVGAGNMPVVSIAGFNVSSFSTPTIDQAGNGHVLLPLFTPLSRARSRWIDTGLATLGALLGPLFEWAPTSGNPSDPAYPLDPDGAVRADAAGNILLPPPLPSSVVTIPVSDVFPNAAVVPGVIAGNPAALLRDSFNPNAAQGTLFTIVGATSDGSTTILQTDPAEGSMTAVLGPGPTTAVRIHPRYFRVGTGGLSDAIPPTLKVRLRFEGADALDPVAGLTALGPSLEGLAGKRFVRFTFDFDMNASGIGGPPPGAARPAVRHVKLPFRF
ncbi:MAG: hypothetical protein L0323_07375 [Planctomycetes bacterium]|nr:hypothetical protein [Planctomycetota bacterium]